MGPKLSLNQEQGKQNQIIRLYFSAGASENDILEELDEQNMKLREEVIKTTSDKLECKEKCLKFQQENQRLTEENLKLLEHLDAENDLFVELEKALKLRGEANEQPLRE